MLSPLDRPTRVVAPQRYLRIKTGHVGVDAVEREIQVTRSIKVLQRVYVYFHISLQCLGVIARMGIDVTRYATGNSEGLGYLSFAPHRSSLEFSDNSVGLKQLLYFTALLPQPIDRYLSYGNE